MPDVRALRPPCVSGECWSKVPRFCCWVCDNFVYPRLLPPVELPRPAYRKSPFSLRMILSLLDWISSA